MNTCPSKLSRTPHVLTNCVFIFTATLPPWFNLFKYNLGFLHPFQATFSFVLHYRKRNINRISVINVFLITPKLYIKIQLSSCPAVMHLDHKFLIRPLFQHNGFSHKNIFVHKKHFVQVILWLSPNHWSITDLSWKCYQFFTELLIKLG